MKRQLHNILSFLSGPKPPEEPIRLPPVMKTYSLDVMLRKLGAQSDPDSFNEPIQKEHLPYGEWRCDYCDHANTIGMIDCHYCGAKKPKLSTQYASNDYRDDDSTKIEVEE